MSSETVYDYIIIGAGPSGLSFAHMISSSRVNDKILLIDREAEIGGIHRVKRVLNDGEELFSEHGPRIYSTNYINTIKIFKEAGIDFYKSFAPYSFSVTEISSQALDNYTFREKLLLFKDLTLLIFNNNHLGSTTVEQYLDSNNFSERAKDFSDRLCRLTDGGCAKTYTMNEFLELVNQHSLYQIYQPKLPNDVGIFKTWKEYLDNKITFQLNTKVQDVKVKEQLKDLDNLDSLKIIRTDKGIFQCKNLVLAIPPENLLQILKNSNLETIFGENLEQKVNKTKYMTYISITFHWNKKLELPKIYGFPKSDWGVVFVKMSDYMYFKESNSKTVISAAISKLDTKSQTIGKSANETGDVQELLQETFNQLNKQFEGQLPLPTVSLLSPNIYRIDNTWKDTDKAFMSDGYTIIPNTSFVPGIYSLGCHNENSPYKFTSMEAAVTNSMHLVTELRPELKRLYSPQRAYYLRDIIYLILILVISYVIYRMNGVVSMKK